MTGCPLLMAEFPGRSLIPSPESLFSLIVVHKPALSSPSPNTLSRHLPTCPSLAYLWTTMTVQLSQMPLNIYFQHFSWELTLRVCLNSQFWALSDRCILQLIKQLKLIIMNMWFFNRDAKTMQTPKYIKNKFHKILMFMC